MITTATKSISVVIPTLGQSNALLDLLKSIAEQKLDGFFEILIIDNSQEESIFKDLEKLIAPFRQNVTLLRSPYKGVNYARNVGILESQSQVLFFVDDDCWLNDKFLLAKHIQLHAKHEECFAIGGYYTLAAGSTFLDNCYHQIQMQWLQKGVFDIKNNYSHYLIGGHCSVKKSVLSENNLQFDPNIVYGGSEVSLFMKADRLGLTMRLENLSLVHRPNVSYLGLVKKLFNQGQGKAYLEGQAAKLSTSQQPIQETLIMDAQQPLFKTAFIYFLNLIFWLGYYKKQGQILSIFKHIPKEFIGNMQQKRFEALKKIEDQLEEKKKRGDRL